MINVFQRQAATFRNEMKASCAALIGIVQGLMADGHLNDQEINFLGSWLKQSENVLLTWPGTVIYAQIEHILSDGVITADERERLSDTLSQLIGGRLDDVAEANFVCQLPLDRVQAIDIPGKAFCFTGDFVFGPRSVCEKAVTSRGGTIGTVTKKLHYLVVGGLGSAEWKHGSFGTKIEKAVEHKQAGLPLMIIHEDVWAASLRG